MREAMHEGVVERRQQATPLEDFQLFDGDEGDLSFSCRQALNALIARPVILRRRSKQVFDAICAGKDKIRRDLSNHFLRLRLDEERGVAWAEHVPDCPDDVYKLKVRRRLHRNTQVLLVMLRLRQNRHEAEGEGTCLVWESEMYEYMRMNLYPDEGDETKIRKALESALSEARDNQCVELVNETERIWLVSEVLACWLTLEVVNEWTERFLNAVSLAGDDETQEVDDAEQ